MECIKNSLVLRLWRLCQQWMGLGLSFYTTLIRQNICVPRDFDATLPKRRKWLPAELQLTVGFHLRRTCWRANSAGFHVGWRLDGIGSAKLLALHTRPGQLSTLWCVLMLNTTHSRSADLCKCFRILIGRPSTQSNTVLYSALEWPEHC